MKNHLGSQLDPCQNCWCDVTLKLASRVLFIRLALINTLKPQRNNRTFADMSNAFAKTALFRYKFMISRQRTVYKLIVTLSKPLDNHLNNPITVNYIGETFSWVCYYIRNRDQHHKFSSLWYIWTKYYSLLCFDFMFIITGKNKDMAHKQFLNQLVCMVSLRTLSW